MRLRYSVGTMGEDGADAMVDAVLRCVPASAGAARGAVYVAARRGGVKLWETWREDSMWGAALRAA